MKPAFMNKDFLTFSSSVLTCLLPRLYTLGISPVKLEGRDLRYCQMTTNKTHFPKPKRINLIWSTLNIWKEKSQISQCRHWAVTGVWKIQSRAVPWTSLHWLLLGLNTLFCLFTTGSLQLTILKLDQKILSPPALYISKGFLTHSISQAPEMYIINT